MKTWILGVITFLLVASSFATERSIQNINMAWKFQLGDPGDTAAGTAFDADAWDTVSVPHTFEECSLNLDNSSDNNKQLTFHRYVGWYRKTIDLSTVESNANYFLHFEGAMQTTKLWVNGSYVGEYAVSGYDSFHFDISSFLQAGSNLIALRVDNTVNESTPPDGASMPKDFVLFGGLYRDVYLVKTGNIHVTFPWESADAGVRISYPAISDQEATVQVDTAVVNDSSAAALVRIETIITDAAGNVVCENTTSQSIDPGKDELFEQTMPAIALPHLWNVDDPYLYTASSTISVGGVTLDSIQTRLGLRTFEFTADQGFFLNGKHLKLMGSNRHQTWPYVGNAVPNSMHYKDAEIMKDAGLNWVRLSHYPHDPAFLNACDELGLLALEEGPTWMGVNGTDWEDNLQTSFRSMIRRDRNHPSIVIWNACINHSGAKDYLVTACQEEDTRPAGASFPRTPMDFSHGTISGGGALTIEHTGHTYPRRRGLWLDGFNGDWQLAKRHWEHINASYLKTDNAGMASWCMFDYNTFHNTDEGNMVWHGTCDLLRLPKETYYWQKSEFQDDPVVRVVKFSANGACVFSNGDEVELFEDIGEGFVSLGRHSPDSGFVLNSPPFTFSNVSSAVQALKAVAYQNDQLMGEDIWRKATKETAVTVEFDRSELMADGSDFSRVIVSVVDSNGTLVGDYSGKVALGVTGSARLIGPNPATVREGKAVVLLSAHYQTGTVSVTAEAPTLTSSSASINLVAPSANTLIPADLPAALADQAPPEIIIGNDLTTLPPVTAITGWGSLQINKNVDGDPIVLSGITYTNGIGVHAESELKYDITPGSDTFSVICGVTSDFRDEASVVFEIRLDGRQAWISEVIRFGTPPEIVELNIKSHSQISLLVFDGGDGIGNDHAVWVNPTFSNTGQTTLPSTATAEEDPAQFGFAQVLDVAPETWVVSAVAMISGKEASYPISIDNGEYQIYSDPWTRSTGTIIPGDALKVRVSSSDKLGEISKTTVHVGDFSADFVIMTRGLQVGESYTSWLQNAATLSGSDAQPLADPDHDGFSNLMEYTLNQHPDIANTNLLPHVTTTSGTNSWVFTYPKNSQTVGVTLTLESSSNLVHWARAVPDSEDISVRDADTQKVEAQFNTTKPKLFLRLTAAE